MPSRLRHASLALVALASGLVAAVATERSATPDAAAAVSPVVPAVDTADRAAVEALYQAYFTPPTPAIGWTGGSIGGCQPGTTSSDHQAATVRRVNYFRALAGVRSDSAVAPGRAAQAQAAALMMSAAGQLSHSPAGTWPCYSADGAAGAGGSNLALGVTGPTAIDLYMEDPGAGNASVGHRWWLLQPAAASFASGDVPQTTGKSPANAVYVFDVNPFATWATVRDPSGLVAWPPRGYVPRPNVPDGRWSVFDDTTNFAGAAITVSVGGVPQPIVVDAQGSGLLVWRLVNPLPAAGDVAVRVQITGALDGASPVAFDYTTIVFTPSGAAVPPPPNPTGGGRDYRPLVPERLLDTRPGGPQAGYVGGRPAAGQTVELQVTGVGRTAVPADATAVALNVTVTEPAAASYVTVWPCGQPRPTASNLNVAAGQTLPNLVMARIGAGGRVCLFTQSPSHLIADVNGWFPAATTFRPVSPERLLDTRGQAKPTAGRVIELAVTGAGRTAVPGDAIAAVLNVTVTEPDGPTYVTVWPCGQARPMASNLNAGPGQTVANLVVARVGAGGKVCLFTQNPAHLVADVNGWFPAGTGYVPVSPQRLLDTRPGTAVGTPGRLAAGQTRQLMVANPGAQTPGRAVVLNVTVTDPDGPGYVTVWPCGSPRPMASNLNVTAGAVAANLAVVAIDTTGLVCFFANTGVDLVVDRNGDF